MCSIKNCDLKNYGDNDKSILHCKKSTYPFDFRRGLLSNFYDEFIKYIVENLFNGKELLGETITSEELIAYLEFGKYDNKEYNNILKKTIFIPSLIHFPTRDSGDDFDYLKILNLFGKIHFNYCHFYLRDLKLNNVECFFQDCNFYENWTLYNYELLENEDNVIYQTCVFYKKISNYTPDNTKTLAIFDNSLFDYTCKINSLELERAHFKASFFNTNQYNYLENQVIKNFKINMCTFDKKFKLNNYEVKKFNCADSIFENKFEYKENITDEFYIYNSNFKDIVDLYGSKLRIFNVEKSIFDGFSAFENCEFGSKKQLQEEQAIFRHATFKDSINARDSKFYGGLDIKNINLQGDTNFLDSTIEISNTNRETFRVLKHSFDSIGNIIEANKYYQKEMMKREDELEIDIKNGKNFFEWLVFKTHGISSNHSQDWILALFWILNITFSFFITAKSINLFNISLNSFIPLISIVIIGTIISNIKYSKNLFLILLTFLNYGLFKIISDKHNLDCVAEKINPFSIMTEFSQLDFVTLIYKIIIGYLIYQLIISIRQNTRRK